MPSCFDVSTATSADLLLENMLECGPESSTGEASDAGSDSILESLGLGAGYLEPEGPTNRSSARLDDPINELDDSNMCTSDDVWETLGGGSVSTPFGHLSGTTGAMMSETSMDPSTDPLTGGLPDYLLGGATAATGAAEFWDGIVGVGGSKMSSALSILGGVNTLMSHDPNIEGVNSGVERAAMGGIDTIWGLMGGPTAAIDTATGGHLGGGLKVLASSLLAATSKNRSRSFNNIANAIKGGKFGSLTGTAARWVEDNDPFTLLEYGNDIPHLMARAGVKPPAND